MPTSTGKIHHVRVGWTGKLAFAPARVNPQHGDVIIFSIKEQYVIFESTIESPCKSIRPQLYKGRHLYYVEKVEPKLFVAAVPELPTSCGHEILLGLNLSLKDIARADQNAVGSVCPP